MSTQEILSDIVSHCSLSDIEVIKISEKNSTVIEAHDKDKVLFINGKTLAPVGEFVGEFGIGNIKFLSGLLNFPAFKGSGIGVGTRMIEDGKRRVVDRLEFNGGGVRTVYHTMDAAYIPAQATIAAIPWDLVIKDIPYAKIAEFQKFASLFSDVDKFFTASCRDGDLIFTMGIESSNTTSGSMVISSGHTDSSFSGLLFPVDKFNALMKISQGAEESALRFSSRGVLGVEAISGYAAYAYYLRQCVRG